MKSKRAAIEMQFNWIFVLIAGAIILAFFITIVIKQKAVSEQTISATVLTSLEAILTGAKVSTGTINIIDLPSRTEIKFDCDKYSIGGIPKQTRTQIIFAPDLIKGRKLVTWALDWSVPYRVTNFLYLTSPEIRYILIGSESDDLVKVINGTLPDETTKELNPAMIKDKNNYKVRFVYINQDEDDSDISDLSRMDDKDVTAIKINGGIDKGEIEFYQKAENSWILKGTTYYLKKESIIGAIFAADIDMYNCAMEKSFKKLNIITEIYKIRSTHLATSPTPACSAYHTSAVNDLQIISTASDSFTESNIHIINSKIEDLKGLNKGAMLYSCALIY